MLAEGRRTTAKLRNMEVKNYIVDYVSDRDSVEAVVAATKTDR